MANVGKEDESYLDNLLNSVMTEPSEKRETAYFKKKAAASLESAPENTKKQDENEAFQTFEPSEEAGSEELPDLAFADTELPDLEHYSIFDEYKEEDLDTWMEQDIRSLEEEAKEPAFEQPADLAEIADAPEEAAVEEAVPQKPEALREQQPEELPETFFAAAEEPLPEAEEKADDTDAIEELLGSMSGFQTEEEPQTLEENDIFSLESLLSGIEEGTAPEELPEVELPEVELPEVELPEVDLPEVDLPKELFEQDGKEAESSVTEGAASKQKHKKEKEKKNSLFSKLFGNVPIDPSKIKPEPTKEEIEAKKKEKAAQKEKTKEEKQAAAEEKKAEAKKQKEEKARLAKIAKEEKKAKKLEEAKLVLEELNTTRINRAGASIVFLFFAMIAIVVIVGTNILSYSIAIKNAETNFARRQYNSAYEDIYGLEVKPEDQLLYDRIMTVMYVQKQLNSYNNYVKIGDEARALDSLLKGLQRYGKYLALADELGITADFDYIRGQILAEINRNFYLSADEADRLVELMNEGNKEGSQLEYSMAVYDALYGSKE